ncbi:hypothetical protein J5226_03320 [Lysobacter sp. K5869]|uniref:hypothetical protein n=1 Tax=Lysobacter sp. K5869 TaxID=2820808 RepID=UPI001C05FA78|nr:hypothetical protein [Lysobacter sp. K5869]QWP77451.1 hypothetical protein J5226_03320 [Lysobacter sp. K5869]
MKGTRPPRTVIRRVDLIGLHKDHFVCFACRKQYRLRGSEGASARVWSASLGRFEHRSGKREDAACPQCGETLQALGHDFKAPARRDRRQWLKVELLWRFGCGYAMGWDGPGERPRRLSGAVEFLIRRGHSENEVRVALAELRARRRV